MSNVIRRKNEVQEYFSAKRGKKGILKLRYKRRLLRIVQKNNFKSIPEIASVFHTASGQGMSEKIIRRCCHRNGIRNYITVSKTYPSQKHLALRLNWATANRNWLVSGKGHVKFSDESSFTARLTKVNRQV